MKPRKTAIRPRGVGPRPGTPKSVRTEGARLLAKLRAKAKRPNGWKMTVLPLVGVQEATPPR